MQSILLSFKLHFSLIQVDGECFCVRLCSVKFSMTNNTFTYNGNFCAADSSLNIEIPKLHLFSEPIVFEVWTFDELQCSANQHKCKETLEIWIKSKIWTNEEVNWTRTDDDEVFFRASYGQKHGNRCISWNAQKPRQLVESICKILKRRKK